MPHLHARRGRGPHVTASGQGHDPFTEPDRAVIPGISRAHVAAMEASADDAVWIVAGMHHVIIRTIGRRSGNEHKVALPFWLDPEGHRIVVASFSGAPQHPAWYLNLTDRTANPEVRIRVQDGEYWADAEILEGDDYTATWAGLTADRAYYNDYQTRTDRRIPLVRLRVTRPV
jgi:deazaflavin-dependent oxidoreductase (nitroreductase family)